MRKEGMISLVNAREVILTSKKEQSFSKLAKRQLASGKERRSKTNLKRIYSGRLERGAIQMRSYSESRIYTIPRWTYSNPGRIESEAELNHYGDVRTSHTINQSNSKYFEVWTIPLQTFKNFEGGLVDTLKKIRFLPGLNNV